MDGHERRAVTGTDLRVSTLGIGGGSLANLHGQAGITALLEGAWTRGLRYFDTAALYAAGESERRFGQELRQRPRDAYVLSTKLGRVSVDGRDAYDYTAIGAERSVAASLDRLGIGRVDIVFIHDLTPALHGDAFEAQFRICMAGAYPVLDRLRAQGTIGAVGIAMADADIALRFAREARFDCFMLAGGYTLIEHQSRHTLLAHCAAAGNAVMVAAPFNTGILATGAAPGARFNYHPAPPDILARVAAIEAVCARHGVPLAAAALQFPLAHPAVASVVAGHQSVAELEANLSLLGMPIPGALWTDLIGAGLLPDDVPTP